MISMKSLRITISVLVLAFGITTSRAASVDRISAATGVPAATLRAERASTGLGWGSLEKAHLLANASGQSFASVVAAHQAGQGWGKIARNNGLKLGTLVSNAHRSSNATMHANNTRTMRGKSRTHISADHGGRTSMMRGVDRRSSDFPDSRGMHSVGHMSGSHSMRSMSHGARHGR
jgi:hypothetical protein